MDRRLSRRDAFKLAAASGLPLLAGGLRFGASIAQAGPVLTGIVKDLPGGVLIPRGTNAEMNWGSMAGIDYLTPYDRFFVRNHTATTFVNPATWRLEVFGSGLRGRPERGKGKVFSLKDLDKLPRESRTVFVECAGNARSYFGSQEGTPAPGTAWGLGAIGVAEWTGVPLREILERAGVRPDAVDVMPEGLDSTVPAADGTDQGHVRRPIPIAKALDDTLVALEMNGSDLPFDHGAPARIKSGNAARAECRSKPSRSFPRPVGAERLRASSQGAIVRAPAVGISANPETSASVPFGTGCWYRVGSSRSD
jgi:DMSO/TMAO reductase YedYZ molybdopterin-dependent catalytic subunit